MTLQTQLGDGFTRVGTEFKTVRTEVASTVGTLTDLDTTAQSNIVAAINELVGSIGSAAGIDDGTTSSSSTWSSQKTSDEIAAAIDALDIPDPGAVIDDESTDTDSVWSSSKTNTTINSAVAALISDGTTGSSNTWSSTKISTQIAALIADGSTASGTTWSSTKIASSISTAVAAVDLTALINDAAASDETTYSGTKIEAVVAALVDSAPSTLDTLNELAAALGDDPNFATTTATALGLRVRVDTAAQGLDSTQKSNARTNIGAQSAADIGDTTTDFVSIFEDALS